MDDREAQRVLEPIWRQVMETEREIEAENVDRDPEAHKTTRLMENSNYRYWPAKRRTETGARVSFCYTTHRNRAGYYLSFREVWDQKKGEGFREKFVAHKKRREARYMAERACQLWEGSDA
jgi:hypothetical protein